MKKLLNFNVFIAVLLALVTVTAASAQAPRRASGLDSLHAGGDLGGNTEPPVTPVQLPEAGDKRPGSHKAQVFSITGRALAAARRGQVVILRRRTLGGCVTEKRIMK